MGSIKSFLIPGLVFLANGIVFLCMAVFSHIPAFWALGVSFLFLAGVFLCLSRWRRRALDGTASSHQKT
ncbi:hypothetical protein PSJM300_16045 [Stutzerimonas stutzeri DSM 10701]|nr:hypothetical protein PSJM300_16045 [Stutzerimonas stutzeri DSM 10701]